MKIKVNLSSLIQFRFKRSSIHFGVYRQSWSIYKNIENRREPFDYDGWLWGRAIEQYDCSIDYFGCGPLFLVCWY